MRLVFSVLIALSLAAGAVYLVAPDDIFARSCVETNTCP